MNNDTQVGFSVLCLPQKLPQFNAQRTRNPPRSPVIPSFSSACAFQEKIHWEMPGKFQCARRGKSSTNAGDAGFPDFPVPSDGMLLQCTST